MTGQNQILAVRVWGDYACFTRPEMKVERVTYPVMTPSAARGILEAIFWKPEFSWRVREIWVLKPIRYFSILRNEVNSRASFEAAVSWRKTGGSFDSAADRAQRHTLALCDVAYLIKASIDVKPGLDVHPKKYEEQFRRRVAEGRSFSAPYLGCREFTAFFGLPIEGEKPVEVTEELGRMLLDLVYEPDGSGRGIPQFFEACLESGILRVPPMTR